MYVFSKLNIYNQQTAAPRYFHALLRAISTRGTTRGATRHPHAIARAPRAHATRGDHAWK